MNSSNSKPNHCRLFHDWGIFTQKSYTRTITPSPLQAYLGSLADHTKVIRVTMQERTCRRCGKVQVKNI